MRHPDNKHRPRHLRSTLVALAIGLSATGALAPRASACGMRRIYEAPIFLPTKNTPNPLLAQAHRHLARHENVSALLAAQSVVDKWTSAPSERAEAYAIIAWVRWQSGRRTAALDAVSSGRTVDRVATDAALAAVGDSESARSLRRAAG
jgi:hypothetical protein